MREAEIPEIFTNQTYDSVSPFSRQIASPKKSCLLNSQVPNLANAAINVMPEGGGGGPRDEVGTLNVIAHPTWGILANFEHKCWPRDREV